MDVGVGVDATEANGVGDSTSVGVGVGAVVGVGAGVADALETSGTFSHDFTLPCYEFNTSEVPVLFNESGINIKDMSHVRPHL